MNNVMYCERCGAVGHYYFRRKCKNCGVKLKILPEIMKQKYNIFTDDWSDLCSITHPNVICTLDEEMRVNEEMISRENAFVMGELANNSIFSMEEYQKQVQKQRKTNEELAKYHEKQNHEQQLKNIARMKKESDRPNSVPKCPICGSININKITLSKRAVKTAVFGVIGAIDDAGKTWKCNNCGSKF